MTANTFFIVAAIDPANWLWICGALGVLFVLATTTMIFVIRKFRPGKEKHIETQDFTLEKLRQMHQQDKISEKEYKVLKANIVDKT